MAEVQTVRQAPAEFIEAGGKTYLDDLTKAIGGFKGQDLSQIMGQQYVAGPGALTTQAEGLASGLGSFEPFLQNAQGLTGPQAYQNYMSPYQQDIIDTTLAEYDVQAQKGLPALANQAIQAGAFGGGREGVQRAEYQATSDRNRAALQAQLLGQGFTQANQLANQGFDQQRNLASLQPSLAASGVQQLGAAGTGNLAYQQALLDAQQQQNQLAYNEPLSRIQAFGSGIASQASGSPTTTQSVGTGGGAGTVGPLSQALSAGLSAYGLGSIFGGR